MNEEKPWYLSKTIWASILQVTLGIAVSAGLVSAEASEVLKEAGPEVITGLVTAVLGALGLYGRVTAKSTLTSKKKRDLLVDTSDEEP